MDDNLDEPVYRYDMTLEEEIEVDRKWQELEDKAMENQD
jgi:hypothetical protein